ncbi:nuclear transport factor 2 family protein [Dokdonella sp.]|uniref:YybH family protein n=1 Tax=Dokdonella sp. TaxID=2291710 RepID=UPI0025C3CCA0|nr:nuclear transport factor 2 family protein [Dokdonella sp.]
MKSRPMSPRLPIAVSLAAAFALPFAANAHDARSAEPVADAVSAQAQPAVAVVERFSSALQAGDLDLAGSLLADDVLILENGGAERSRAEYLGGHARHDAQFLKQVHTQVMRRTAKAEGDLAWVGTESELHGRKDGKPTTVLSTETMLLQRGADGWRIAHIHWSSRPKR